ncbi:hypothetical protein MGU_09690 [Metarhizium guizhouense ARSEF 977]|uniref:Uncharacterized protein n=1 Tax=Metarhizium guizhouense (strain ARSEF 977) TaxID=1276136 RepID=A0A0B4HU33_METGA|nr:hypothetical protein MGU_09690 [Metarhizium guizhouense ARSEF 977]
MDQGYRVQNYSPWVFNQSREIGPTLGQGGSPRTQVRSRVGPILTISLCFAVSIILATVVFTTPKLKEYGTYTAAERTVYNTIVTIIATIITTLILQEFRFLYLDGVDDTLSQFVQSSPSIEKKANLGMRWQIILAISRPKPWHRNLGVYLTFLLGALVTTCINAGFTATTTSREVPYSPLISASDPYIFARPWDTENSSVGCVLDWKLSNGSFFCSWVWHGGSPQHRAFKLMDGINVLQPDVYAYADLGVAIHSSAIGAPVSLYDAQRSGYGVRELASEYEWNLNTVSACVPVMVRNPVKCRPGGEISYSGSDSNPVMKLTSNDGSCSISQMLTKPKEKAVYMLKHQCTHGEVGQATYIIGAANSDYARWVALGVGENIGDFYAGQKYSIECEIDVRNGVFEYRNVTLALGQQNWNKTVSGELAFNRFLSSSGPCIPPNKSALTDALFATVATAPYFTTYEDGGAGWAQSLVNVISRYGDYGHPVVECGRQPPWAFHDSNNALEDVLGLLGGLAASRSVLNMSLTHTTGSAQVQYMRVGSGKAFAVIYAVLPLFLGFTMTRLLARRKRLQPQWQSSKMDHLVDIGRSGLLI